MADRNRTTPAPSATRKSSRPLKRSAAGVCSHERRPLELGLQQVEIMSEEGGSEHRSASQGLTGLGRKSVDLGGNCGVDRIR